MWTGTAWDVVVLVIGYGAALWLFNALGGFYGAADAFERWGRASATKRLRRSSSSVSETTI